MQQKILNTFQLLGACLLILVLVNTAAAKGSELKFDSAIQMISQTDASNGTVTIVINGFEVPIVVNAGTEIHSAGNDATLDDLAIGDSVRIEAFFSDEGITAEEIRVLEMRGEHFRLRGRLTEVEADAVTTDTESLTRIQLLGIDVHVGEDTHITQRGGGFGNNAPVSNLTVGTLVDLHGFSDDTLGLLLAERIHIGSRQLGQIELEGEVISVGGDNTLTVMLEGGGEVTIVITEDTNVSGDLQPGVFVEIEGMLNEELTVTASEIVVDTDNDGDGDDDNDRRPDLPDKAGSRLSATLVAVDAESGLTGRAKIKFPPADSEIEIEVEGADPETIMSINLMVSDTLLDLGTMKTDAEGEAEVELEFGEDGIPALPEGSTADDVSTIELSVDGTVVLQASF